ncbi:hypothetical protein K503DRAFT_786525, partial [Rhizopogon vinicolor AM-OR11-026]
LDKWHSSSKDERRVILKASISDAKLVAPKMDAHLLKERWTFILTDHSVRQIYKNWFYNQTKRKRAVKNQVKCPAGDRDSSSEYESEEPDEPFDKRRSADEELEGGEEEEEDAYEVEVEIEHAAATPMPRHGKSARADMVTPDDSVEDRRPKRTSRLEQSASDEDEDEDGDEDGDGDGDDVPTKRTRSMATPSGEMQRHQRPQRQRPKRYM